MTCCDCGRTRAHNRPAGSVVIDEACAERMVRQWATPRRSAGTPLRNESDEQHVQSIVTPTSPAKGVVKPAAQVLFVVALATLVTD